MNSRRKDERIFEALIRFLHRRKTLTTSPDRLILEICKLLLGKPYGVGTLETKGAERLVVNLRAFDCFTFVETVITLAWCLKSRQKSFEAFRRRLKKIRYRNGCIQGYPSRLHYFSDWIYENQRKGIIRDVTADIGGRIFRKTINFMTKHPGSYPPLKVAVNLRRMKSVEKNISRRSLYYIPKTLVRTLEDQIHDGDVIAITTNTEGLDVQHVGFAMRVNNRTHLLHASCENGKVALSKLTLYPYLMQSRACSGMMVAQVRSRG